MNTVKNIPAHCHDCPQVVDCKQAQNMVANTTPVEGFIWNGDVYCAKCDGDADPYDQYGGKSDSPIHCTVCGVPIIHELTPDGVEYVRKLLVAGNGCCDEVWPTVWADYLN